MSCGAEGLLLALKLATELVDKPWQVYEPYSTLLPNINPAIPPWQAKRIEADDMKARDDKRHEFHQIAEKCLKQANKGYIYSDTGNGAFVQDLAPGTLVIEPRARLEQGDGCLVSDGTGKWTPCGLPKKK